MCGVCVGVYGYVGVELVENRPSHSVIVDLVVRYLGLWVCGYKGCGHVSCAWVNAPPSQLRWFFRKWVCGIAGLCVLVSRYTEVIPLHSWLDIVYLVLCVCGFVGAWVRGLWVCGFVVLCVYWLVSICK